MTLQIHHDTLFIWQSELNVCAYKSPVAEETRKKGPVALKI